MPRLTRLTPYLVLAALLALVALGLTAACDSTHATAAAKKPATGHVGVVVGANGTTYATIELTAHRKKAKPLFTVPVRRGSTGKQVLAFKWVAAGHDPSHYRSLIHYRLPKGDQCGRRCVKVILNIRWLLGEPQRYDKRCKCQPAKRPRFTRELYLLLTGQKKRPLGWIGREAKRLAIIHARIRKQKLSQGTNCAQLLVSHARRYIGIQEQPPGSHSNTGYWVSLFQAATTYGHSNFPWCAAYVNFVAREVGITPRGLLGPPFHLTRFNFRTPGPVCNGTAGVYVMYACAQRLGWLRARPVVGAIVLYMTNGGHTGFVTGVGAVGFSTVEGNCSDRVCSHSVPFGYRNPVFLVFPCVQGARA
jgi:CHAP domain